MVNRFEFVIDDGASMRKRFRMSRLLIAPLVCFTVACFGAAGAVAADQLEPGLTVTFVALNGDKADATDTTVLPNAWLYVPAGKSPTPFLPAGRFSAEWSGYIASEIRDNYTFQAELNGALKLEINGVAVLEAIAAGTNTEASKSVRLNKGTNAFKLHFTSPAQGDAFTRLSWSSKEFAPEPVTLGALTHATTPELQKADQLRTGRELFLEFRCAKCHAGPAPESALPELAMDAPSFEGIGSRRNFDWLARWIADPKSLRPTAHMPKLLRGAKAVEDAEAAATFLASLKSGTPAPETRDAKTEIIAAGKKLFETLHCIACHNTPATTEDDAQKISFTHVREKFASGALVAFLQKPEQHYAWIRMPNFKLTADEAAQLAAFAESAADKPKEVSAPTDAAIIERGRKLIQTTGCLNCHVSKIENQFKAEALAALTPEKWQQGCLAENAAGESKAPQFGFSGDERAALRAFLATDHASLARHVPAEFAARQTRRLRCAECHGKYEGFPPFEILGGKLKPEWMRAFIGGTVDYKPRPWIEARMPAFANYAAELAVGLAEQHGLPPQTPPEPPFDQEAAKIGRKLVSASGGFFCVSCHAVGSFAAQQVFESNGLNLAYTGARLQKNYYHRWVRGPLRVEPATKMPVYFDTEGRSPLTDYYDGDADKQIEAIWQYIRAGEKIEPPITP